MKQSAKSKSKSKSRKPREIKKSVAERITKIIDLGLQNDGQSEVSRILKCSNTQARYALKHANKRIESGEVKLKAKPERISKINEVNFDIKKGEITRYILTSAQDDTEINKPFWNNLKAYAKYLGAEIKVAGFTYQKGLYDDHAIATASYNSEIRPHMVFDRARITDNLLFISDANVLPTTVSPLAGWQIANCGDHVVVPSSRVALESIARMNSDDPRFAMSTGCITMPSYTPRAAGRKAIFHHTFGALLIEVDTDGEIFHRHLLADSKGDFQDLSTYVKNGKIFHDIRTSSITWGDIHHDQLDQRIALASFGYDRENLKFTGEYSLLDELKPFCQVFHDTLDFNFKNHHKINNPIAMARLHALGKTSVVEEIKQAVNFVNGLLREDCTNVVVESNHDSAIARWLLEDNGRIDPENAQAWHELNADWHKGVKVDGNFNITEHAFRRAGLDDEIEFIRSGESYKVNEIEHGLHGDCGTSGSRGTPAQFRRFGRKVTSMHTHSPKIADGSYIGGVSGSLKMGYNEKGMTTWAHAHVLQYANNNRCMIIMSKDGRYKAVGKAA